MERFKSLREKFYALIKANASNFKFFDIENFYKISNKNKSSYKGKLAVEFMNLQQNNLNNINYTYNTSSNVNCNNGTGLTNKKEMTNFMNLIESFFKKNINENENQNIAESLEKLLFGLIQTVEHLQEIFKFSTGMLQGEKNIEFNLQSILVNELWNHFIQDDLVFFLLKFAKAAKNSNKLISDKLIEYIEIVENGVKSLNSNYSQLMTFFNIHRNDDYLKIENSMIYSEGDILMPSDNRKNSVEDNTVTSSEREECNRLNNLKAKDFNNKANQSYSSRSTADSHKTQINNNSSGSVSDKNDKQESKYNANNPTPYSRDNCDRQDKENLQVMTNYSAEAQQGFSASAADRANKDSDKKAKKKKGKIKANTRNENNEDEIDKKKKLISLSENIEKLDDNQEILEVINNTYFVQTDENTFTFQLNLENLKCDKIKVKLKDQIMKQEKNKLKEQEKQKEKERQKEKEKEILSKGNLEEIFAYINSTQEKSRRNSKITNGNSKESYNSCTNNNNEKKKNNKKKKRQKKNSQNIASKYIINNDLNGYNTCITTDKQIYENNNSNSNTITTTSNSNNNNSEDYSYSDNEAFNYDKELECFKKKLFEENRKASNVLKIKPFFSDNWLQKLN